MWLLLLTLRHYIRIGTLTVVDHRGRRFSVGDDPSSCLTICFHNRLRPWRMAISPGLGMGEGYMNGQLTVENGSIYDLLVFFGRNIEAAGYQRLHRFTDAYRQLFRRLRQRNLLGVAQQNVAHHYDLSGGLYELFLDADQQYSCAYFADAGDDLETAQENKKHHIAAKLLPRPGDAVLDIGSGWGGLGLYLAETSGANVTGITLSEEQHKVSNRRAEELGLADCAKFYLRDYREQTGLFDRIVSVGMLEHVGVGYYRHYFNKLHEVLADDGVALLHTIGRSTMPSSTDPWIQKYIFPGGYIPSLSEVVPHLERTGLVITDIEFLGPHYAETLRHWRERFCANWDKAAEIYDQRFCRMWEYYLAASEMAFRHLGLTVFQIQMVKRRDAVPLTRDYISDWERDQRNRRVADDKAA